MNCAHAISPLDCEMQTPVSVYRLAVSGDSNHFSGLRQVLTLLKPRGGGHSPPASRLPGPADQGHRTATDGPLLSEGAADRLEDWLRGGGNDPTDGQRGPSAGQQGPSLGQQDPSPGQQGLSLCQQGPPPGQQGPSPGQQGPSLGQQGPSPCQQGPSLGQQGPSLGQKGPSPAPAAGAADRLSGLAERPDEQLHVLPLYVLEESGDLQQQQQQGGAAGTDDGVERLDR